MYGKKIMVLIIIITFCVYFMHGNQHPTPSSASLRYLKDPVSFFGNADTSDSLFDELEVNNNLFYCTR